MDFCSYFFGVKVLIVWKLFLVVLNAVPREEFLLFLTLRQLFWCNYQVILYCFYNWDQQICISIASVILNKDPKAFAELQKIAERKGKEKDIETISSIHHNGQRLYP